MKKRKIGNCIILILLVLTVVLLVFKVHILGGICTYILEWNLKISQGKFLWLFLMYWIEFLVILALWDLLIKNFSVKISLQLDELSENLLIKKRLRLSIFFIRINYAIKKLLFFLRLGWWSSPSFNDSDIVWESIRRPTIIDSILGIVFSLIKFPTFVALFLTVISQKWFSLNALHDKWKAFSMFKFDLLGVAKIISPLTFVVLVLFIWYFISFRGNIRRSIAQANRKKMENIIQNHQELVEAIADSLYLIAYNLEYVINCQELIADLWILGQFPDYKNEVCSMSIDSNVEAYCFEDIPKLEVISQKFSVLNSNGNWNASSTFSSYKYEFLILMSSVCSFNVENLNEIFFTKEGIKKLISDAERPIIEYSVEEIQKKRKNFLEGLPRKIVNSLKLLYKLCRYYKEMNKLLNFKSDKVGRFLRMFTDRE